MNRLIERVFPTIERKLPLDCSPLTQLPQWGHWIETPDLIAAMLTPGQLEVNLLASFELISTRFQPGYGRAAFASDKLIPYRSAPGGFDVVPQGSTYRSVETAGVCIVLVYKPSIVKRIMAEYTDGTSIELIPGQIQSSEKGTKLAGALRTFFADAEHTGGTLYLESLATLVMGHLIRQHSTASANWFHKFLSLRHRFAILGCTNAKRSV